MCGGAKEGAKRGAPEDADMLFFSQVKENLQILGLDTGVQGHMSGVQCVFLLWVGS